MSISRRQGGTSMIEVLVTIVIVAFGLLGFAGLLTESVRDNRTAYYRSQATALSYSILECMRANRSNAVTQAYNIAVGAKKQGNDIAATDINTWKTNLAEALPGGDGSIRVEGNGSLVTIVIQWDAGGNGTNTAFRTQTSI